MLSVNCLVYGAQLVCAQHKRNTRATWWCVNKCNALIRKRDTLIESVMEVLTLVKF